MPRGTGGRCVLALVVRVAGGERPTVSEILQVDELIAPLGYYSEGVFNECDYNEEAADRWEVPGLMEIL